MCSSLNSQFTQLFFDFQTHVGEINAWEQHHNFISALQYTLIKCLIHILFASVLMKPFGRKICPFGFCCCIEGKHVACSKARVKWFDSVKQTAWLHLWNWCSWSVDWVPEYQQLTNVVQLQSYNNYQGPLTFCSSPGATVQHTATVLKPQGRT